MAKKKTTKKKEPRPKAANGEGCMMYREDRQCYSYSISYRDSHGGLHRKWFYAKTEDECRKKAADFMNRSVFTLPDDLQMATIPDLLKNKYNYQYEVLNKIKESTFNRKLYNISLIEKFDVGKKPVWQVTNNDIIRFCIAIQEYSNSTISKTYASLKEGFNLAVKKKIIDVNPLNDKEDFECPKSKKADKKVRALTRQEEQIVFKMLNEYKPLNGRCYYKYQYLIALHTGMRMGEINALRASDIDFENRMIHVQGTVTRGLDYSSIYSPRPKTACGNRKIPMTKEARKVLELAIAEAKPNKYNLIFFNFKTNAPISTQSCNRVFTEMCKKYGLEGITQHSLRHTYATRNIEAGVPAEVLKVWLGHRDIQTTINTYVDVFDARHYGSVELYDEYMEQFNANDCQW